jgi:hypothetical protein
MTGYDNREMTMYASSNTLARHGVEEKKRRTRERERKREREREREREGGERDQEFAR